MSKTTVKIDGKPVAVGTAAAFQKLAAAFKKQFGLTLHVRSGLRTRAEQQRLYDLYKSGKGNLAARPGTSRHESGKALDVYDSGRDFGVTRAGTVRAKWLRANASKYGFKANGYAFKQVEPWHIEYTGDQWKAPKAKAKKPTPGKLWFELGVWNISLGNAKGIKNWVSRRAAVAAKIKRENPAVLCLQEAYLALENGEPALTWLESNLPDHRRVVTRSGRAILVRNDVKVVASGVFDLLTRATGQPKKYATWAHLLIDGAPAFVVNAHAQHGANRYKTREKWVTELANEATRIRQIRGIPTTNTFFAGDWNGKQGRTKLADRGYVDAVTNAVKATNSGMKTLNSWKRGLVKGARIDYLMVEKTRPVAAASQSDDSALADHNYQSFQISRYKK